MADEHPINPGVTPLPWVSRISGMPYLPGGAENQVAALQSLLQQIEENDGLSSAEIRGADGKTRPVKLAIKQIAPAGLVHQRDRQHFDISEDASRWLTTSDHSILLGIFHRNVRFLGELMEAVAHEPLPIREINNIAVNRYRILWSTLDQVRRRVAWLIALGYMERKTSQLYGLTELGVNILRSLELGMPETLDSGDVEDVEIPQFPTDIQAIISGLGEESLVQRNAVLGYIPRGRGTSNHIDSLYLLVNACSPQIAKAELLDYAKEKFSVSESSFGAILTTLTKSGLVEQSGFNIYSPTAAASQWLESGNSLDLIIILHSKFKAMLDIIPILDDHDNAPDLARYAVGNLGFTRVDQSGIRTRLQILRGAGLIREKSTWRYEPTKLGLALVEHIPFQSLSEVQSARQSSGDLESRDSISKASVTARLMQELVEAGTASEDPERLERAVASAVSHLGFHARHLGGAGRTDVLASIQDAAGDIKHVIIDAKSARSGNVQENSISFDTLMEHKARSEADFVAVVGPGFDSGRIRARAEQNGVRLITTQELARVLERFDGAPMSAHLFVDLVDAHADSLNRLEDSFKSVERRNTLLTQVVGVLFEESREADDVTQGALSSDQLYLIIRDDLSPRPTTAEIDEVLGILEHPLINSVREQSGRNGRPPTHYLVDPPSLIAKKLSVLAQNISSISDSE